MGGLQHVEIANKTAANLVGLAKQLKMAAGVVENAPDDEVAANVVSMLLGEIHQVGENAMNDYRVNRKVAKVERRYKDLLQKRETK